jgi:hypothetical protein
MRLMADPAASVTLWAAPVIRFLATSPSLVSDALEAHHGRELVDRPICVSSSFARVT